MLTKLAYAVEMSFDVPDSEKEIGEFASQLFEEVINSINLAKDHLDIIYNPFKRHENISTEAIAKRRGKIDIYKNKTKDNFEKVKFIAFKAIDKLNYFSSDTHTMEMINSFRDAIGALEKQVVILLDVLDNYRSPDFRDNVLKSIEAVRKEAYDIEKLIKDRIVPHIDTNILARDWISNTSNQLQTKIQDRIPIITELFNQRQKALEQGNTTAVDIHKRPQSLNPSDNQRIYYPSDLRNATEVGE